MQRIGVFDSGVGGLSVVQAIEKALPGAEVTYVEDTKNVPYGNKSREQLLKLVLPKLQDLQKKTDVIVIACNTVTTTIIEDLRTALDVPLIGMEPMIKPAAELTKTGVIAVCATPATLASERYAWLKETYAHDKQVLEPDCSEWASMVEANHIDKQRIEDMVSEVLEKNADVIVLGCTHYHWIEDDIKAAVQGRAVVIQPETPVISQLERVLQQRP